MSYDVCKECGVENPINTIYCQECGRRLINSLFYDKIISMANEKLAKNKIIEDKREKITNIKPFEIKIEFSDDPELSKSANKRMYAIIHESITLNYNFSDEVKEGLIHDLIEGMENYLMPNEKAKIMSSRLNGNLDLAKKIEHEEVMRAAHLSDWIQSKAEGCNYFIVDYCNSDNCINKFEGQVFSIDDIENIPPIYSNCGCVTNFFQGLDDSIRYAKEISQDNAERQK